MGSIVSGVVGSYLGGGGGSFDRKPSSPAPIQPGSIMNDSENSVMRDGGGTSMSERYTGLKGNSSPTTPMQPWGGAIGDYMSNRTANRFSGIKKLGDPGNEGMGTFV